MNALRHQFTASVHQNIPLCREHFKLVLRVRQFPPTEPGQFVQILCRDADETPFVDHEREWESARGSILRAQEGDESLALLRRPFSLAGRRELAGATELDIIHRVVGVGTSWLAELKPSDSVDILGPLGNHFKLPLENQTALLVAGGVGIPPMIYLAEKLKRRAIAFCGATTLDLLPLLLNRQTISRIEGAIIPSFVAEEFARHAIPSIITTDDGSFGFRGFVTDALEQYLDSLPSPLGPCPSSLLIYTCGPEPMMKRVAHIAVQRGIECQVAVERAMACGMGTCQSCCIRVRKPDPAQPPLVGSDWCYQLTCTDGPIFRAHELLW